MKKEKGNQQEKKSVPREIGSNLTGTAIKGKPGHERDVDAKTFEAAKETKGQDDDHHIENTDALLGDVQPTRRNPKSQKQHNNNN